jgi:hypothetical protein
MRYKDSFGSTKKLNNLTVPPIDIMEDGNPTQTNAKVRMSATTRQPKLVLGISCISVACVVIRSCNFFGGNLKSWNNDMDMESWQSWMYANVFRAVELGNVAIMSHLVHRITLKNGLWCEKRSSNKTLLLNA